VRASPTSSSTSSIPLSAVISIMYRLTKQPAIPSRARWRPAAADFD
jgi:hypothetical protein